MADKYSIKIIGGNGNPELTKAIAKRLNLEPVEAVVSKFSDGETKIEIKENLRGCDVFIVQPTCMPVNDNFMELLLLTHTVKLASAKRITVVIPYFGYARQDRKTKPRVPISASLVAQLIESSGPDRVLTLDLHCGQIQGFFRSIPVDNLYGDRTIINRLIEVYGEELHDFVVVSPDAGGVERARRIAEGIGSLYPLATIIKRRVVAGKIDSMQLVGEVKGHKCLIADDMIDSGGTLVKAAELLEQYGAIQVVACATHGVFSGRIQTNLNSPSLDHILVTDSCSSYFDPKGIPSLEYVSVGDLLGDAIRLIHNEESLAGLF
jgi:ribose-phosphate pyrophosphokinase